MRNCHTSFWAPLFCGMLPLGAKTKLLGLSRSIPRKVFWWPVSRYVDIYQLYTEYTHNILTTCIFDYLSHIVIHQRCRLNRVRIEAVWTYCPPQGRAHLHSPTRDSLFFSSEQKARVRHGIAMHTLIYHLYMCYRSYMSRPHEGSNTTKLAIAPDDMCAHRWGAIHW